MKNKQFLIQILAIFWGTFIATVLLLRGIGQFMQSPLQTQTIAVDPIASMIAAAGTIHSQNEATLHFQTGGKLVYLPFKEGDHISDGQTIAQLDTYVLQKDLQLAANTYQQVKNNTDQVQENNQAGVVEGQQRTSLDASTTNSYNSITEAQVVTDMVKRFVDNSILTQNSAQLNVDIANYAVQLSRITAPFDGIITHEDVTVASQNVTTTTSFSIADPNLLVFKADVPATDIDFISVGSTATIRLNETEKLYTGTVTKIYPDKITLSDGEQVYKVDVQSTQLKATLGQSGSVTIQSNTQANVILVPTWTVLSHQYVWVMDNNQPVLKKVSIGKTHGNKIEITAGLQPGDKVIVNPKGIAEKSYSLL